ncbi:MAG: hypothetical protein EOP82_30880 [Variovorax sp.]|nr:MAG: hypothetical protein EOP82_30880 [Variovorax sp.]
MDDGGDKSDRNGKGESSPQERTTYDPAGYSRTTWMHHVLWAAIAVITLGALAASIPSWGSTDFPVASLIIYVAGMVFVTMPLCLCYESMLKAHEARVAQARQFRGTGFQNAMS